MRDLDETDLEILRLLVDDARRPFREIAEIVNLSPPTVSDRVDRLRDLGVIRGFTTDVDRSKLTAGTPILVDLVVGIEAVDETLAALEAHEDVEHAFATDDAHVICTVRLRTESAREFLSNAVDPGAIREYDVRHLAESSWQPDVGLSGFELRCDECGNAVTSEGEQTRFDGDLHQFCCENCLAAFRERYDRMSESV